MSGRLTAREAVALVADDFTELPPPPRDSEPGAAPARAGAQDAGQMAACLQASLLVRFAPPAVADAFCATRLGGDYNGTLGTLPAGLDLRAIVDRTSPTVG